MAKQWHKITFPLGTISPVEIETRVKDIFEIVRPLIKKRSHGSPWYRFESPKWTNVGERKEKHVIVLIPCLDDYTVEIYRDLGYDIESCNNITRGVRRMHFTRIKLWEDHI